MARLWHSLSHVEFKNGSDREPGLLTHSQFVTVTFVETGLLLTASILGMVANLMNIIVFVQMRPYDGVTVSFLGLSCADFLVSVLNTVYGFSLPFFCIELKYGVTFTIDPYITRLFFGNLTTMVYTVTMLMSGYIALVRCMCVAKPLEFKNTFTARLSLIFICACIIFAGGIYIPLVANTGVQATFSPELNTTRYVVWFSPYRKKINTNKRLLTQTILPFGTEILIFVCVAVMAWYLRKSLRLRQGMMAKGIVKSSEKEDDSSTAAKGKLSGKELQVVRQVLQISIIYIVFNTPMICHIIASTTIPGYDNNPREDRYARLHASATPLRKLFEQTNSAVNFFIYYRYNSRFKSLLKI